LVKEALNSLEHTPDCLCHAEAALRLVKILVLVMPRGRQARMGHAKAQNGFYIAPERK
jgi:hypothetical protein